VVIPPDVFLSWFSLPTPRLANSKALRRVFEPSRDRESGPESFLAGAKVSVVTVLRLTARGCSAWGTNTGSSAVDGTVAGAAGASVIDGIGAGAVETSWRITTGDKEILIARCGCG